MNVLQYNLATQNNNLYLGFLFFIIMICFYYLAQVGSNQIMGWGEKAIEVRNLQTGTLDSVFMQKRRQMFRFLCERNEKVGNNWHTHFRKERVSIFLLLAFKLPLYSTLVYLMLWQCLTWNNSFADMAVLVRVIFSNSKYKKNTKL